MIQCNVYDWTLAGYKFDLDKDYDVHTELHLNNKSNGYIRVGFTDNGETKDVNNAHMIEWANENGFKWRKLTRANGNDTVVSTALTGKQIKYNEWVGVDFKIRQGRIYATYKTPTQQTITDVETFTVNEIVQDVYVGEMDYDFWFGMSSWISRTNGMACRKFIVKELNE